MSGKKEFIDSGKPKILMVDDDSSHLKIAEAILRGEYDVYTAVSGKEALDLLYKGLVPQLILLDIVIRGMDGWETYNRIRAISFLHDTQIAFFTITDDPKDIQKARDMGAADYIKKPINKTDLLDRVGKILKN
jgi:CheY-like chemotaxis protein